MGKIGHGYGSEWHLLRYLGYHRHAFNNEIINAIGEVSDARIEWLDFKFSDKKMRLRYDKEWTGMDFIDRCIPTIPDLIGHQIQESWQVFWPQTGNSPTWDAIGMLRRSGCAEILLVEAKAHTEELRSNCGARDKKSERLGSISIGFKKVAFPSMWVPSSGLPRCVIASWEMKAGPPRARRWNR